MKKYLFILTILISGLWFTLVSCNSKNKTEESAQNSNSKLMMHESYTIDSVAIIDFYNKYPKLESYKKQVGEFYLNHNSQSVWHNKQGLIEFGSSLYLMYNNREQDGLQAKFPYEEDLKTVFEIENEVEANAITHDLLLTNLYLFFAEKEYGGLNKKATDKIGWLLPRKEINYSSLLDSVLLHPKLELKEEQLMYSQYGKLKNVLKKYRLIEKNGGWGKITTPDGFKSFKPGDSSQVIQQIRTRLFLSNDLKTDSKIAIYDDELKSGFSNYLKRNGFLNDENILPKHINALNVPIAERIKQIMVNMERCRWVSPELEKANEYIMVNIPSYFLYLNRGGKKVFESPVVVGQTMKKTVIFGGKMSYIVFSPYWNVPSSIINKEVKPGMAKNKNYLASHHMEWNNGSVRQTPGEHNSLGLVKFIFPNSNNIYLHDTPSRGLFANEERAYSHGCVRVGKPRDLAVKILENDKNWSPAKIDAAMHKGQENTYVLKNKIPVHIGYFTAEVKEDGQIYFYKDIYERDEKLAKLIFKAE